jgi:hypothetical protein
MIIYGSKSKLLAQQSLSEKCPSCGTQNSVAMHVFQRYAHVFWIPFFPTGKLGVSQCGHCKKTLRTKEMSPALKAEYENLQAQAKTPVWTFIGVALLAVLIVSIIVDENRKSAATAQYIKHLQPNDLLETKTEDGYTYLKVTEVKGDSVYFKSNKQAATLQSGLTKLGTSESSFYDDVFSTTQQAVTDQYNKKEILNVIRR